MKRDIADYAKDSRLTEPSGGKRYEWQKMIDAVKSLGRPLTDEEAEQYWVKQHGTAKPQFVESQNRVG